MIYLLVLIATLPNAFAIPELNFKRDKIHCSCSGAAGIDIYNPDEAPSWKAHTAEEARKMSEENFGAVTIIDVYTEAVNKAINKGAFSVDVRIGRADLCPPIIVKHFTKLGYNVKSTNEGCDRYAFGTKKSCADWGYCIVSWEKK